MRKLWTEPLVNYKSDHHLIENAGISPMPIQQPIPVWFGGWADAVLKRAAHIGDGWMPAGRAPDDSTKATVDKLRGYVSEAGRSAETFGLDPWISIGGLDQDEWHRRVGAWREIGASHVAVDTMRAGFKSPQEHIDAIRLFRQVLD